jgi:hypothetical protein
MELVVVLEGEVATSEAIVRAWSREQEAGILRAGSKN